MFKNKKFSLVVIGALALTLALGLVAFAPIDTASAATPDGDGFSRGRGPGGARPGGPANDEALAEALGISVEELETAYATVQAAVLEQAVADGKITQEQADQMAERGFSGRRGFGGDTDTLLADTLGISVEELQAARESAQAAALEQAVADGKITEEQVALMEARQALQNYMPKDEMLAKALGITVDELEAAKEDGQRIPDLLEELGIEQEDFEANMQAVREEMLQQAVEDGVITQEQADQMLENGFQGKHGSGGRDRSPGGKEGSRPGNGEMDGTNFQRSGRTTDEG